MFLQSEEEGGKLFWHLFLSHTDLTPMIPFSAVFPLTPAQIQTE